MIKKNLFLLFCFYLFVVQLLIGGVLWNDCNFFILSAINFVVIIIIAIFSKGDEEKNDKKGNSNVPNNHEVKEEKQTIKRVSKGKKITIPNVRFFIIAVLCGLFAWFRLNSTIMHLRLLISIAGSFVVYVVLGLMFRSNVLKTKITIFYVILIILSGIRSIINLFNLIGNVEKINTNEKTGNVVETINESVILGSGIVDNNISDLSGDVVSGNALSGIDLSGGVVTGESEIVEDDNVGIDLNLGDPNKLATFREVLKFILKNETLSTNTTLSFVNLSKSDLDYSYFRTAYDKKMIGTDIIPTQKPSCETFVVMKGLNEGRDVGTYTNIKQAYWKYASDNNKLPDCKYGSYIKIGEMK